MKINRPTRSQLRRELRLAALRASAALARLRSALARAGATWRGERELITVLGAATLMLLALGAAIVHASAQHSQPTHPAAMPALITPVAPAAPVPPSPIPASPTTAGLRVRVAPGDTLAGVALREGVPFEQIAADNAMPDPSRLVAGQSLLLRPAPEGVQVIQPGRTLSSYAQDTGISVAALLRRNPQITDANQINAGGRLQVSQP